MNGNTITLINSTAPTEILAAPSAGRYRKVGHIIPSYAGSSNITVVITAYDGTNDVPITTLVLGVAAASNAYSIKTGVVVPMDRASDYQIVTGQSIRLTAMDAPSSGTPIMVTLTYSDYANA